MLRITISSDSDGAIFKMEGKLAHEWVAEAQKAWAEFTNSAQLKKVVVDLRAVSFVDDPGHELLAQMHDSGASLVGTGPMSSALIEEIRQEATPRKSKLIRSLLSLFFLLPLTGVPPRTEAARLSDASPQRDGAPAMRRRHKTEFSELACPTPGERSSASGPTRKGLCS